MRFKGTVLAAVLTAALGLIPILTGPARADVVGSLPISSFGTIVADSARGHLFITQASGDTIVVTDLFGTPVKTITGEGGVDALVLSADGSTLYAALGTADAVSAISTTTLAETARYSLGSGNAPASLAVQSGKVWVSYSDTTSTLPKAAIGEIDPATGQFTAAALPGAWYSAAPALSADPAGGGVIVAREGQYTAASYNVSTDPVTTLVAPNVMFSCEFNGGVAVLPGGASVIMPCTGVVYSTSRLSQVTDPYSGIVSTPLAVASNGLVATAGATFDSSTGNAVLQLLIYPAAGGAPQATDTLPNVYGSLTWAGMSWAADGSGVFTVLRNHPGQISQPDTYTLREFFPAGASTTLAFWGPYRNPAPASWPVGQRFGLTGTLKTASGPVPAKTVTIARTCPGAAPKTLTTTTGNGGAFSATDTITTLVTCTYVASFAGGSALAPARGEVTVSGSKVKPVLTVRTSAATVDYESRVKVTVHLGATDGNRKVALYAAVMGSARRLLWNGTVNGAGNATVQSPALARNTIFAAVFAGDARDLSVTTGNYVHVRVRVLEHITGYYKTVRATPVIWYYHRSGKITLYTKVIPNEPGQCFKLRIQVRVGGSWKGNGLSGCGHLSGASLGVGYLTLTNASLGYQYRVRIEYVPRSSDHNGAGYGSWMNFVVTK